MEISNKPGRLLIVLLTIASFSVIFYVYWYTPNLTYFILILPYLILMFFYKKIKCTGEEIILSYPFRLVFRKKIIANKDILKVRFIAYDLGVNSLAQISVIHKKIPFYFEIRLTDTEDSVNFFKWTIKNSNYKTSSSEKQEKYIIQRLDQDGFNYENIRFKYKNKLKKNSIAK